MKKNYSQLFAAVFCLLLIAGIFICAPKKADAAEPYYFYRECLGKMDKGSELQAAYDALAGCVARREEQVDVRSLGLSQSDATLVFTAVYSDHPELFWVKSALNWSLTSQGVIVSLIPQYYEIGTDFESAKASFDAAAKKILSGIRPFMSEYEKEKYIHDALATSITYDLDAEFNQSAYSALVNGRSVCAGYTKAFVYLLRQAGVRAFEVTGQIDNGGETPENHAWIYVNINGEYYQTDLTSDDSYENSSEHDPSDVGSISYAYFNVSDTVMSYDHYTFMLFNSDENYFYYDPDTEAFLNYLPQCTSAAAGYPAMSGVYYVADGMASSITVDDVVRILSKPTDDACRVFFENPDQTNVNAFFSQIQTHMSEALTRIGAYAHGSYGYSTSGNELMFSFITTGAADLHGNIDFVYNRSDSFTVSIVSAADNTTVWSGDLEGIGASYIAYNLPYGAYTVNTYLDSELIGTQSVDLQSEKPECDLIHNVHAYDSDGYCSLCGRKRVDPEVTMAAEVSDTVTAAFELTPDASEAATYAQYSSIVLEVTLGEGQLVTIQGDRTDGGDSWRFDFESIYAKYMADEISGVFKGFTDAGPVELKNLSGISISEYCSLVAKNNPGDAKLLHLMADMLEYGAACQVYSGYRTDTLANSPGFVAENRTENTIPAKELVTSDPVSDNSYMIRSANLRIADRISLYFTVKAAAAEGVTLVITPEGGASRTYPLSSLETAGQGIYRIDLEKLSPQNYGRTYTVTLMKGADILHGIRYSVDTYLSRKANAGGNLGALIQAIYDYSCSASEYVS